MRHRLRSLNTGSAASELRLSAFPLGANQLHKVDRPGIIHRRTSRQLGKESTVIDVTRLTIQQIQEVFLQGFATSPRLG